MGFPEDSGVGKAGLAEGWNRLMLSRGVEACRKLRPLLLCKAIWPSRVPQKEPRDKGSYAQLLLLQCKALARHSGCYIPQTASWGEAGMLFPDGQPGSGTGQEAMGSLWEPVLSGSPLGHRS